MAPLISTTVIYGYGWLALRPDSFIHGEVPEYPSTTRLSGPQGWAGVFEEDRKLYPHFEHFGIKEEAPRNDYIYIHYSIQQSPS
jgi:hypothetical protein